MPVIVDLHDPKRTSTSPAKGCPGARTIALRARRTRRSTSACVSHTDAKRGMVARDPSTSRRWAPGRGAWSAEVSGENACFGLPIARSS